jgi:GMP synthase (glutamine-hydrolysing)
MRAPYPRRVPVEVVLTELESRVSESRARSYARLRERLAAAAGDAVEMCHYEQVDPARLRRASSIVLSGSWAPWAEHDPARLERLADAMRDADRPVLGICAGMQLQAVFAGGTIGPARVPERGYLPVEVHDRSDLLRALPAEIDVFQDHTDEITSLPKEFRRLASSPACAVQAIGDSVRRWWGTQFHPENFDADHPAGEQVLRTFFALAA